MNLKENLVSFLTSSILAFLADYFGLGRLTRQLLSFVAVRHLLPAPPPSHTISYTEPPPTAAESAQNDEEPYIYTGSRFHTTWIPPDSPVYGFNWYLILVLTTVMFFCLVRLALHLYSSYMTQRCTTLPQRNLLDLAFSEEYEEIKEYPPSTPEPLSMTSVLRATRLALNSSASVALESISRLDVFYPYIAGFSRWTSSRGHFSSVADMTMVNYAGDQGSEHAGDSIESENCSVVSVVSGMTDDLEDEEGSLLPDFAEESGSSLAEPLSVETGGSLIQEPITETGSTPALSSTAIVDAQEASTSSYEEFDAPRETNTSEVPPLPQVSSEPASSHALSSEPSVLQFDLGEFFASPPARPQDGASDAAAGGSSDGALQLDGPEHAGLGVASEPSVQFDLGQFFAAPKPRPAEAQEISLVVSPLTSPDRQPPSATTADPPQSTMDPPSTDLQPSQGSSFHASVAHLDGSSKILDSNPSTASEDAVLPIDAGRDTSSDVSADSSVLTGRNREHEPVLVVPSISIDLDTLSESAGAEDSVQAKDLANEALGSDTCDGDSSGLGIDIGSSSFPRYEHGSPLFAIIEDSELSQEHISAPNSPAVRLEDPPLLVLSPNPDCESPPLLTPHELGGAFSTNPEDIHSPQDEADPDFEVFNSSTLPAEFPLIRKELAAVEAIDEDIDDWDWTLLNVALHEQFSVVCPRSTAVTQQAVDSGSICDDPFLASSPVRPSDSSSSSEVKVNLEENSTTDHQRASSESITRCEQVRSEAMIGVMPLALTAEQAQDFSRVCGNYGLILPGGSACALYQAAAWDRLSFAEARLLKAAAKRPKQHRRRRSSLAPTPSTPQRPHGYGLSRANFIGVYAPLLYTAEKTYASISRRGVSPSPTASPASVSSVSVAGSFEPTKGLNRTQSLIDLNRSRGGMDIAVNGANLKAQPATHHLKTRRSLGSIQNPTAHQMLHSILPLGQKPKEVPGAGRGRSPSASPKPHSTWVREMVQEPQVTPLSKPAFGAHRRCASQSAMIGESSTSFSSPRAGTPSVQRGRPTRHQIPLPEQESPASSSAQAAGPSSSAASPGGRKRGKGKRRETSAPAPAERVLARPPTLNKFLQPSLPSSAQTICTTARPGLEATKSAEAMAAMVYARVDDDGAVERFEKEQGFA